MLNELLIVERGARKAGIAMDQPHPDVKDARLMPTLKVQLDENGNVVSVSPVPVGVTPWTLRDGQHNSFPFVQPKDPLWDFPDGEEWRKTVLKETEDGKRTALLEGSEKAQFNVKSFAKWPGNKMIDRLKERNGQLDELRYNTEAAIVPETIRRFLCACDTKAEGNPQRLLSSVANYLVKNLRQTAQENWLEIAVALLVGKKKEEIWRCAGALLFEASGYGLSIYDRILTKPVSKALYVSGSDEAQEKETGICGLTGEKVRLLKGKFHQPNLKVLGQTWLFSKNKEIPSNDRYGKFAADSMPVGVNIEKRLAGALKALTSPERNNKTWRSLPGERPKQSDLLLAFVEEVLDIPLAEALAEEDFAEEETDSTLIATNTVAMFEKRTERLIDTVRAKVNTDLNSTPVRLIVIRKVDQANRKVVYAGSPTVADLDNAAKAWAEGERNAPPWLTLPVVKEGEQKRRPIPPPHVAPLGLIAFSRKLFIRDGTESKKEIMGLPAAETLRLFLDPAGKEFHAAWRRTERVLRLVLTRRDKLLIGVGHIEHTPESWKKREENIKKFNHLEALRTTTILGVLLHKLGRKEEVYMNETAFKLGQLLAAADVVHAGYCADVRGGDVPPSLLGNQVFTMAQSAPVKALAMLCRRWKPYDGWAKKTARDPGRADKLISSKKENEKQRGWDIKKALSCHRKMGQLASELAPALDGCRVDDVFRAELLLGYIAGLPKRKEDPDIQDNIQNEGQED